MLGVFTVEGRWCRHVVLAFIAINLIVLLNAILHDPRFGYDAPGHIAYVKTLADRRLPTPADSHEFFSPPLPYVPAAIAWKLFDGASSEGRQIAALKTAQLVQFLGSIVTCWSVLAIAKLIRADRWMALASLIALGMVPAYYRTFAMVRGEPMMVALLMLGTYHALRCFAVDRPTVIRAGVAGLFLGGAMLSRQWALLALPALALVGVWRLVVDSETRRPTFVAALVILVTSATVGGWFYVHLHQEYGSMRAFNRAPEEELESKESDVSPSVFRSLLHAPVRHAYQDHPAWLFYADTWGDYWRYFLISARDQKGRLVKSVQTDRLVRSGKAKSSNSFTMPAYLGRVCVVSIVPSVFLLSGLGFGLWQLKTWRTKQFPVSAGCPGTVTPDPRPHGDESRVSEYDAQTPEPCGGACVLPVIAMMTVTSLAGYVWFVWTYPNDHLDTVKASYMLQILPLLAISAAAMWCALRDRSPRFAKGVGICVLLVLLHNLPAMVTRYSIL